MTQPRSLHELYQLLWEHIKDELNPDIIKAILKIRTDNKITETELKNITGHYISNYSLYETRREAVQRMIEETKNN